MSIIEYKGKKVIGYICGDEFSTITIQLLDTFDI